MAGHNYEKGANYLHHLKGQAQIENWLQPGDVILVRKANLSYQLVGQGLSRAFSGLTSTGFSGSAHMTHAAIVGPRNQDNTLLYIDPVGGGIRQYDYKHMMDIWAKKIKRGSETGDNTALFFYRCSFPDLADMAAQIAYRWSAGIGGHPTTRTGFGRMAGGTFGWAGWNESALIRAIKYTALRNTDGPNLDKETMCSTFVVAAYQAAGLSDIVQHIDRQSYDQRGRSRAFRKQDGIEHLTSDQATQQLAIMGLDNGVVQGRMSRVMAADAKFVNPAKLHARLKQEEDRGNGAQWYELGFLVRPKACADPHAYLADAQVDALKNQKVIQAKGGWKLIRTGASERGKQIEAESPPDHYIGLQRAKSLAPQQRPPVDQLVQDRIDRITQALEQLQF